MAQITNHDDLHWTRLKMGDPEGLGYLYDRYADSLFLAAMRITDDRDLAKDALQEVFIECWNYRETLGDVRHSLSYLSKVLRNILVKKLRSRQAVSPLPAFETLPCPEHNREDSLISLDTDKEKSHRLKEALSNLTTRQALILKLHFYEGLSYEQIADKLSMNYQSVNNLAFRTIMRLRRHVPKKII
ncbi:sigma-70 family RNA polymerase sigma factor [Flavitalea sp. BT771]|uniref:RNA polymerase sigma factor n=1 Tax=Flavitalea sp. BT771 TaxID=3063329 RepID=UPI0026E1DE07|nr:sigma-70 family RNA polymerase sigma factor [Flavitalea sp. BT771]MDO6432239.1 sigma-70 family RNA polymerase sigma factor [Flavitalea sp. BT771]MDV6221149.1 sigma-70 family RNA polymerase sigma factor [Flavitalea sp. BT771]